MANKTISICIPVHNEAESLPLAVAEVETLFEKRLPGYALELVITDNGSSDPTWSIVQELAKTRPTLKAFRFSRNFGYQNSVFAGISMSTGDAVVELDADLEDPPEVIVDFVDKWERGYKVVYGVRKKRYGPLLLRGFFRLFYLVLRRLSSLEIPENSGDFRLLDRQVVNVLKALPERNLYLRGLVAYIGFPQVAVYYDRHPRVAGKSKFRFLHYITLAIDGITALSKAPLRAIGVLGFLLFTASVALGIYYLVGWLVHGAAVPGFTTLVVLVLVLNGLNFVFVGVIGEYLSRIFDDSKGRPRIIIAESINSDRKEDTL